MDIFYESTSSGLFNGVQFCVKIPLYCIRQRYYYYRPLKGYVIPTQWWHFQQHAVGDGRMPLEWLLGKLVVNFASGPLCENMTSSTKSEVHNVLHCHHRRTEPQVTCRKFGEIWRCGFFR